MPEKQKTRRKTAHLADIFSDLFILATQLKNTHDYGQPALLRQRIIDIFDRVERRGYNEGISKETMQQAKYAIAAFLDEIILSSPWPEKEHWSARPLQYEFFKEHIAGLGFFNRLETLRRSAATQRDLLEIYYICLILGFEGQYKLQGKARLKSLITDLSREIEAIRGGGGLSPNGRRPEELIEMVKQGLPSWVVLVTCAALIFFLFLALSFLSNHDAAELAQNLNKLLGVPK